MIHTLKKWGLIAAAAAFSWGNGAYAYFNRGVIKFHLGKYQGAIGDSDQALQLQPENADTYARRGNSKCELGQFQEDFADLKSALELAQEAGDSALAADLEQLIQSLEQE